MGTPILTGLVVVAVARFGVLSIPSDPQKAAVPAQSPETLVARAGAYVDAYERELSALVAEEDYLQRLTVSGAVPQLRRLRSDFLIVRLTASDP